MGNPLRIFILSFSTLNWGNFDSRISDLAVVDWSGWCSAKKPWLQLIYIPMCDLFWGGIPCKFLFCTFHVGIGRRFRWHEASVWVIKPAQALYPSDMPMSEPIRRGNPLQFFYFAFCNLELRGFWQEDSQEVAVGPVDVPRGDVYNLCLTPPMFTYCI